MQGDIEVHSLPGKGATFWFTAIITVVKKERIYFLVIKEPLQDWEVNEISRDMLQNDHAINVIGDDTDLPELLNLGITAKNIIIISDRQHKINEDIHLITSPLVLIR
jgi:hypothetical protein